MRTSKPLCSLTAALASFALLAFACGCGSGGGDSSTSASETSAPGGSGSASATGAGSTSTSAANQNSADPNAKSAKSDGAKESGSAKEKPATGVSATAKAPAPTDPKPLPNQGSKAVAPEVPTTKGGDNSIQEYGTEATSAERVEVSSIVQDYLSTQAAGSWGTACSYLWSPVRERMQSLGESAGSGQGCAEAMAGALSKMSQAELQKRAEINVLSMRTQGERAFVIYRDGSGEPFNLPLIHQDGEWKITTLAGIGLVL